MSSNAVTLPMTDPTTVSGSSLDVSSSTVSSGLTVPSDSQVKTGADIIETIEQAQFATYPATVDVPILQPPPPELRYLRTQHPSEPQLELQAQFAIARDTPSRQLMSAACGSTMVEPLTTQHLDHQRAVSMQPLGQDAMRVMPHTAPLPGLNLLMGRMADNRNNWSAGLSQAPDYVQASPYVQDQRTLSQQPTAQPYGLMLTQDSTHAGGDAYSSPQQPLSDTGFLPTPASSQSQTAVLLGHQLPSLHSAHDSTLVYDQSNQLLSMRPRAYSEQSMAQQPLADVSVGGDVSLTSVKISSSPLQQAVSSAITDEFPLVYVQGDQISLDQRTMSQQIAQPAFARPITSPLSPAQKLAFANHYQLYANCRSLSQPVASEKDLTGLSVGDSFASISQTLSQQSTPRGPPPGLPATGGFIWPETQGGQSQAEQFMAGQHVSSSTVATRIQQSVSEHTIPDPVATFNFPLNNSQLPQGSVVRSATTHHSQKPVFGFATTSEAENFQPSPRTSAFGVHVTHGLPSVVDPSGQVLGQEHESQQPSHKKIIFGFPAAAARGKNQRLEPAVPLFDPFGPPPASNGQVKPEQFSPAPLGDCQTDMDGNSEPNLAAQVWGQFAPYSASFSDVREQANFGGSKGSNDGGFAQVSVGNPLSRLEPGESVDPNRYSNLDGSLGESNSRSPGSSAEHLKMGRLVVNLLSSHQVLFIFHVLAIMAHLRPEFVFRHGGENATKIGARLTLWGHTVVIDPITNSVAEAKVAACRRALGLIQENDPEWLVPPQPIDGPTTPDWNWIWMLEDWCMERAWSRPLYRPSSNGDLWHCDISVNDKLFCTVRECNSLGESQNTAAHTALYQLLVIESGDVFSDSFSILPVSSSVTATATAPAPVSESIQKQCAQLLRSGKTFRPNKAARPAQYAGVAKAVPPSKMSKRARKKLNATLRQQGMGNQNQSQNQNQPQPVTRLPPPSPPPVVARASNMIPLTNSRLAPICETAKPIEDPLAKLKSIEKELKLLSTRASFRRVMEKICDVLGANYPTIIREKKPGNGYPYAYEMLAKFESSHPYLSRASPIKLADVENPDPEIADEIAVKHVILHMLKMAKEDANVSDKTYKNQLGALHAIEGETRECLDRQSRPSGLLSY